jgi:hypothetical protein
MLWGRFSLKLAPQRSDHMRLLGLFMTTMSRLMRPSTGLSPIGWSLVAVCVFLVRLPFGGSLPFLLTTSAVATLTLGGMIFLLFRSFWQGDAALASHAFDHRGYELHQAAYLLKRLPLLSLVVLLLGLVDHSVWWVFLGLPLILLLAAAAAMTLSEESWELLVFLPMCLAAIALLLWVLLHLLGSIFAIDLGRYWWVVLLVTASIGVAAIVKIRSDHRQRRVSTG